MGISIKPVAVKEEGLRMHWSDTDGRFHDAGRGAYVYVQFDVLHGMYGIISEVCEHLFKLVNQGGEFVFFFTDVLNMYVLMDEHVAAMYHAASAAFCDKYGDAADRMLKYEVSVKEDMATDVVRQ